MDATDEMHVFGFADPLLDEEDHEARRHEGHGEDDADGHKDVHGGRHPGDEEQKEVVGRDKEGGGGVKRTEGQTKTAYRCVVQVCTHRATWDSCSLVKFSGWLTALMPYLLASLP